MSGWRLLAHLVRVAGVVSFVVALTMGGVPTALFALVLLGLTLLRVYQVPPVLDLATGALLVVAAWSAVLELYQRHDWLDVAVHLAATGLVAGAGHHALAGAGVLPRPEPLTPRSRLGLVLTTAGLGTVLAVLWELGEWFGHTVVDSRIHVGYDDTVGDLAVGVLGAVAAGLLLARARPGHDPRGGAARDGLVSVVIPVKDDAPALRTCLQHLRGQTVAPLEVVVVDNGSTDESAAVAASYGARVVPEPAPGIPVAAARGYDAARGEVIARCDADSVLPPDWVERVTEALEVPGVAAVTGPGWFYDLPRAVAAPVAWFYLGTYFASVHAALGHTALWGSNMAMRREAWAEVRDQVHRDDSEIHDDMDLSFVLGPQRTIRFDRGLRAGVSARCLHGREQRARRMRRAWRTLRLNWADTPPWERWAIRLGLPTGAGQQR